MSTQRPDTKEFEISVTAGVATVAFNRPNRKNAISQQMYLDIISILRWADESPDIVCVLLTGNGDYYSSGNDLSSFALPMKEGQTLESRSREAAQMLQRFFEAFIDFSKPLIAAVNGPALGVAVTSLALCDFVYASETATFYTPFVSLGQACEGLSSYLFPRLMGSSKANEVLLTGLTLTAKMAEQRNLVAAVLPVAGFREVVHNKALEIAKLPVRTLQANKRLIRSHVRDQWLLVNKRECDLLAVQWVGEDCMNALANFMASQSQKKKEPRSKL